MLRAISSRTNKVDQLTREAILLIQKLATSSIISMEEKCSLSQKLMRKEKFLHHSTLRNIISILIRQEVTLTTTETANLLLRRTLMGNSLTREEVL